MLTVANKALTLESGGAIDRKMRASAMSRVPVTDRSGLTAYWHFQTKTGADKMPAHLYFKKAVCARQAHPPPHQ